MEVFVGVFVIFGWVAGALLVGYYWQQKNLGFARGLLISILLSPVISLVIGLVMQPGNEKRKEPEAWRARTPDEMSEWARNELRAGRPLATEPADMKRCPFCAEDIKAAAVVFRYCGRDLPNATGL